MPTARGLELLLYGVSMALTVMREQGSFKGRLPGAAMCYWRVGCRSRAGGPNNFVNGGETRGPLANSHGTVLRGM